MSTKDEKKLVDGEKKTQNSSNDSGQYTSYKPPSANGEASAKEG